MNFDKVHTAKKAPPPTNRKLTRKSEAQKLHLLFKISLTAHGNYFWRFFGGKVLYQLLLSDFSVGKRCSITENK